MKGNKMPIKITPIKKKKSPPKKKKIKIKVKKNAKRRLLQKS